MGVRWGRSPFFRSGAHFLQVGCRFFVSISLNSRWLARNRGCLSQGCEENVQGGGIQSGQKVGSGRIRPLKLILEEGGLQPGTLPRSGILWEGVEGSRVEGRGWCEGGTPGEAGEKRKKEKKEKNTTTLFINSRRKVENGRKALVSKAFLYP